MILPYSPFLIRNPCGWPVARISASFSACFPLFKDSEYDHIAIGWGFSLMPGPPLPFLDAPVY